MCVCPARTSFTFLSYLLSTVQRGSARVSIEYRTQVRTFQPQPAASPTQAKRFSGTKERTQNISSVQYKPSFSQSVCVCVCVRPVPPLHFCCRTSFTCLDVPHQRGSAGVSIEYRSTYNTQVRTFQPQPAASPTQANSAI